MKKLIICAICAICGLTTANAQKFGHVNTQEIIQAMPEFVKAQSELKSLQEQYEADLKAIQDMYQKYQQSAQDNQQALYKAQQEKMQVVSSKLNDAIKAVGQEGNYVYIMQTNVQEVIPYISTTLSTDVTAQVKAKLGLK